MKQEQLFKILTNMNDFSAATGFNLELTTGGEISIITEVRGNVEYYVDELEAIRMEDYTYFNNAMMVAIGQSQLRKEYISSKLKEANKKAIDFAMNKPEV